jgi:hypothetical protein
VAIQIIAVRLSGGTTHEHISHLWWIDPSDSERGDNSRAAIVGWIENQGGKAFVDEGGYRVDVYVRTPAYGEKYLQTAADGRWQNNLLALPKR